MRKEGRTPLHVAAKKGREDVVHCLLVAGADVERADQAAGDFFPLARSKTPGYMAMGQNPNRTPSEHPKPTTKERLKRVVQPYGAAGVYGASAKSGCVLGIWMMGSSVSCVFHGDKHYEEPRRVCDRRCS